MSVILTSEVFTELQLSNSCNSVAIKNLVKIVTYLECLVEVCSTVSSNAVRSC